MLVGLVHKHKATGVSLAKAKAAALEELEKRSPEGKAEVDLRRLEEILRDHQASFENPHLADLGRWLSPAELEGLSNGMKFPD
ncbi:MAG: hypothetical protein U1F15_08895 [Burkholderiales bacterium]